MASCRYHVGTAATSSGAAAEPHATTTTTAGQQVGGLFLPRGGLTDSRGGTGGGSCHPANILISPSPPSQPGAAGVFSPSYAGVGLVASAGGAHYPRSDMTQLMTLPPHPSHHQHQHQQHQHQHTPGNVAPTSAAPAPVPRDAPACMSPVVKISASRSLACGAAAGGNADNRKSKRAVCKSTYKHVPHREKAPHLVARRNARERRRVQAVNTAFVRLRRHVPHENRHKRLSKVKTLHFAIDYINYMQRLIHEYDAAVHRAGGGGGGGGGGRGAAGGGAAGGAGMGANHTSCGLQPGIDMVELNSTKENRWMPVNLPPHHGGDQTRGLYLSSDGYGQYHQG